MAAIDVEYEGRALAALFVVRNQIQETQNLLKEARQSALTRERLLFESSMERNIVYSRVSNHNAMLGSLESNVWRLRETLYEAESLERQLFIRILGKTKVVVENVDHVNFLAGIRITHQWGGQAIILRPLFPSEDEFKTVRDRCQQSNVPFIEVLDYDSLPPNALR